MTEPKWLSPEELEAWMALIRVIIKVPALLDQQLLRDSGLNHFEYGIMARLSESPGRTLQMSTLAEAANGSLSRLSHAVKRLEQRGWVRRSTDPDDGRLTNATLTEAGWEQVVAAAPGHVEQVRRIVFGALSPEQVRQLHGIGSAVLAHIDELA